MKSLTASAASEFWLKALGMSDVSGLQAARPRLLIKNAAFLCGTEVNIGTLDGGSGFTSALLPEGTPGKSTPVCLCLCLPGPEVVTDMDSQRSQEELTQEDLRKQRKRASGTNVVYVVPAQLVRDGSLSPRRDGLPFIVRKYLEPEIEKPGSEVVGEWAIYLREMEKFASRCDRLSMSEYWASTIRMFGLVAGVPPKEQTKWFAKFRILLVPTRAGTATKSLAQVYEHLGSVPQGTAPLVERLISETDSQKTSLLKGTDAMAARSRHVAMVDRVKDGKLTLFPLDSSQRRALHGLLSIDDGSGLVAVSGPPGTGKTDMLRAVIATVWTRAALQPKMPCPLILICGATRQSVRNVMTAFEGAERDCVTDPLKSRWVQGIGGYAASFSARSRLEEDGKTYQTAALLFKGSGKGGQPEIALTGKAQAVGLYGASDLVMLANYFLKRFRIAFSEQSDVLGVVNGDNIKKMLWVAADFLQAELVRWVDHIEHTRQWLDANFDDLTPLELNAWAGASVAGEDAGWSLALGRWKERHSNRPGRWEIIEGVIDVALRSRSFHLAARYWEARWLLSLPERESDGRLKQGASTKKAQIERISMLTPCLVSTLHSAPRLVEEFDRNTHTVKPGWQRVDLLVVDEAGQAAPELGAAVLALAKKALVVGDLKQLAPITQMVPAIEEPIALACHTTLAALSLKRADSSTGSVMAMAIRASSVGDPGGGGGIRLRNHYRCSPPIINFCVSLMYGSHDEVGPELVPMLPAPGFAEWTSRTRGTYPLPPIGFVQGGSPQDVPDGRETKRNVGEAKRIADWLRMNGSRLLAWHREQGGKQGETLAIEDIVKIVTPFRGQVAAIKNELRRFDDWPDEELQGLADRLTVGTVHTMQGAEAPVVLFSAVNQTSLATRRSDPPENKVFIDRDGGNLLNVAVSRAQKSFILFGHGDLFFSPSSLDPENDLPTALLGRYLSGQERGGYGVKLGPLTLVVVESAAKAKIIGDVLGSDYVVVGTNGHFRELASLDLDDTFAPVWTLSRNEEICSQRRDLLRRIGSRLMQTRELVLATDADREGEAIAWHFLQVLKLHPWWHYLRTVSRVTFDSLSEAEIRAAFGRPVSSVTLSDAAAETCLDMSRAHAALARGLLDADIGAMYWKSHRFKTGRVGSLIVRLLAGEIDNAADERQRSWFLDVSLRGDALAAERDVKLFRNSNDSLEPVRFLNRFSLLPDGPSAAAVAEKINGKTAVLVKTLPPRIVAVPPPNGLSTADVLRKAWRLHGIPPCRTMVVLQGLYERDLVPAKTDPVVAPDEAHLAQSSGTRLALTASGIERARHLKSPTLDAVSGRDFAERFEDALEVLSEGPGTYSGTITDLANRIRMASGREPISDGAVRPPSGSFVQADTLWSGFPDCPDGLSRWAADEAAATQWLTQHGLEQVPSARETFPGGDPSRDAHPSLAPLSLTATPGGKLPNASDDLEKVYAIVWGQLAASVLKPARLQLTRMLLAVEGLKTYGLTLDMAEIVSPGFAAAEPGLQADLLLGHVTPIELDRLRQGSAVVVHVHGTPTHETLNRLTLDGLLHAMEAAHLGRPSTYAEHTRAFIGLPGPDLASVEP